jgi:hypothetical protein
MIARRIQWTRSLPFLALAAVVGLSGPARAADPLAKIENVRIGYAATLTEGQFKVGAWTPVWVDLKSGSEPFKGLLEVEVPDDDGTPTIVRREVDLPARTFRPNMVLYTRAGSRNSEVHVRVRRTNGRVVDSVTPSAAFIDATQRLVLTMGNARGVSDVTTLAMYTPPNASLPADLNVASVRIPDGIPNRAEGFDAAEAIVIDTNNQELMDALSAGKAPALVDWVKNGGHLVLAVAANWQQVKDSTLAPMLPAMPSGTFDLRDPGILETFAGSKKFPSGSINVAKLEPVEDRHPRTLITTTSSPLVVRGAYGFGRVTVVGLNVDQKPFTDWEDKKLFWAKVLEIRGRYAETAAGQPNPLPPGAFYQAQENDLSSLLHMSLERFPGVKLVPFGWVAFFVFLYILLIGPGDYLFLKKVLKRMELTWITFPTIVIAVSLLAYVAAYAVKGTDLKINKVDVVDVNQVDNLSRGTSWMTLFSPQNRDYDVKVTPVRIDLSKSAKAPAALPVGTELNLTWFNAPESRFGGVNTRLGLGNSGYQYWPMNEAQELKGVRVQIWSTKSFTARWSGPAVKVADSDLRPFGTDRLSGSVTNRLKRPLKNAVLVFGKQVYDSLGTIEPDATVTLDGAHNRTVAGWLEVESQSFTNINLNPYQYNSDDSQGANIPRASLARVAMFREAMGTKSNKTSIPLQYLDLTGLTTLNQPILVAEIDGPAADLDLGPLPTSPQTDQTTLVRVILPIAAAASEDEPVREKVPEKDAAK